MQGEDFSIEKEAGFAFILIPVLLACFGLFVTAMMRDMQPNQFYFEVTTQENMVDVRKSIAAYAHRNYRVPCPADPSAAGSNLGLEGSINPATNECNTPQGILPFRELGLPQSAAQDEWGNYLTYKVSPNFTRNIQAGEFTFIGIDSDTDGINDFPIGKDGARTFIHQMCRTNGWIQNVEEVAINETQPDGSVLAIDRRHYRDSDGTLINFDADIKQYYGPLKTVNANIYKASFCCPVAIQAGDRRIFANDISDVGNLNMPSCVNGSGEFLGDGVSNMSWPRLGAQDEIIMKLDYLDPDLALWDANSTTFLRNLSYFWLQGAIADGDLFTYNDDLRIEGYHIGDGIGVPYQDLAKNAYDIVLAQTGQEFFLYQDANGDPIDPSAPDYEDPMGPDAYKLGGKFDLAAVMLEMDHSVVDPVSEMRIGLSDVGVNNLGFPFQMSVTILDSNGNPVPTSSSDSTPLEVSYVRQVPQEPVEGQVELKVTATDLLDANIYEDESYFTADSATSMARFDPSKSFGAAGGTALPAQAAIDRFNASKLKLETALADAGLDKTEIRIGRVKLNTSTASFGINSVSYTEPVPSVGTTDLVIKDEEGDVRLRPRSNVSFGPAHELDNLTAMIDNFEAPAYVLISHGENGEGSYRVNGTMNKVDNLNDLTEENPDEVSNYTDGGDIYDVRKIISQDQTQKFDDIIMWDSQVTLYNSLGNGTCGSAQSL